MQVKQTSRGLGDSIAKLTSFFGIKPCGGCDDRRDVLNRWLPYEQNNSANSETETNKNPREPSTSMVTKAILPNSNAEFANSEIRGGSSILKSNSANLIFPTPDLIDEIEASARHGRDIFQGRSQREIMEIVGSTGWRAPDRIRGPADLEGDRRDRRTDRRSERDERRTGLRRGASPTSPTTGGTPTSFACGVDVTSNTQAAVRSAKTSFRSWTNDQKHEACEGLHSFNTGSYAWDILELHSQVTSDTINRGFRPTCATSGASPACGSSVTVDGSCHFAGSANYVIFGVMCKLCSDYYVRMLGDASWYELIDKSSYQNGIQQFTQGGMLGLIDLYKKYIPLLMLDSPAGNIDAAKRWSTAGYNGWPAGAATPASDRANCTLTCPSTTTLSRFNVSWYPHLNAYSR